MALQDRGLKLGHCHFFFASVVFVVIQRGCMRYAIGCCTLLTGLLNLLNPNSLPQLSWLLARPAGWRVQPVPEQYTDKHEPSITKYLSTAVSTLILTSNWELAWAVVTKPLECAAGNFKIDTHNWRCHILACGGHLDAALTASKLSSKTKSGHKIELPSVNYNKQIMWNIQTSSPKNCKAMLQPRTCTFSELSSNTVFIHLKQESESITFGRRLLLQGRSACNSSTQPQEPTLTEYRLEQWVL